MQIDLDQFRLGLEIELQLAWHDSKLKITRDEVLLTGRIVWIHLKRVKDYYTRLDRHRAAAMQETKSFSRAAGLRSQPGFQQLPEVAFTPAASTGSPSIERDEAWAPSC
jgi:hypothetical protein